MPSEHIHFVTGRLAEPTLRSILESLAPQVGFRYTVHVMRITVAALMTTDWLARHLKLHGGGSRVVLPGYCRGDLEVLRRTTGMPVELGPKDVHDLPEFFGRPRRREGYGPYDIEIIAEINHCPRLPLPEILRQAADLRADGADVIDLGCDPGETWSGVGDTVRALRDAGCRVSIDSFNPAEVEAAVRAGAELVFSVNGSNRGRAADWGCEVVVVPDQPGSLEGLAETVDALAAQGVPLRIDPILEPIGFGFAESLGRYLTARRLWPEAEMLMGIGNLTELTETDSAPVNLLLLSFCQELRIRSVLTTQVVSWARSCVRECDLARRLAHYAVQRHALPKHVDSRLLMLRDPKPGDFALLELERLAAQIRDHNFRIFVAGGRLHLVCAQLHLTGEDPFELFDRLLAQRPDALDASHAFYLGYELAKATTALTLGKRYCQDEALRWGFLTRPEKGHLPRGADNPAQEA